ncbi:uncharacterized transmembrane protein DDB_G0289901-like [Argiope bruennichi]|uniref:uncharacterized transmembrane protein DDB_G0289901-like n=1 Tax=Argiope bruennichi TaxID=94029 RepID=UPI00249441EF|nr:uncharacterized transmembrane protein DDB_G0289901-like [Argiope bruennichi]
MRRGSSSANVRWHYLPLLLVTAAFSQAFAQTTTTTAPTTITAASTTNSQTTTSETTTAATTTPLPLLTTEASGTTLTAADSAAPTTTVATESSNLEATTEGQASNEALRTSGLRRGYRFESTRNKPLANQEATPKPESGAAAKEKPEEKKIAWKFGRGGNNQEGWSVRPTPNSGYPLWKKQVASSNGGQPQADEGVDAAGKKPGDQQAYIVWSVGQGNAPNGWTLSGAQDGWAPEGAAQVNGGWNPGDATVVANGGNGGWNADGWVEEQPPSEEDNQEGGWVDDEGPQPVNANGGWVEQGVAPQQAGWVEPNGNVANGWDNGAPQTPVVNAPPQNGWAAQPNAPQTNGWSAGPPQAGNNGGGWAAPQQGGNGWAPPVATGQVQPGVQAPAAANGWNTASGQIENAGWDQNAGGWANPAANGGWNNGAQVAEGGGWNNGQQNGGWNGGLQDAGLSWKVYNEDTHTMENLDDNSGWKVIGDGGADGWKLVDENGNVEWKIENINGEWKVTSADELPTVDNSTATAVDATNATTESTNSTSEEVTATTPAPGGGWDDDKQGRYIVWKFSEDGKGEARVYGGGGGEPEVWRVGDNNQYWKETMGIKSNDNSGQVANGGWTPDGTVWQNDGVWQNAYNQGSNSWQKAAPQQNNGWQNGGASPQVTGSVWQNGGSVAPAAVSWQAGANAAPKSNGGRGWKAGTSGQQGGGNGWKQKVVRPTGPQTTTWSNSGSAPQQAGGWQNQQPQTNGAWNGGNTSPQIQGGWQNAGASNTPANVGPQGAWQNGVTSSQSSGGWTAPGTNGKKGRAKGRWRNSANGNRNPNGWQQNKLANANKNGARGSWNNGNNNAGWAQRNAGSAPSSWNNAPSPTSAPTVNGNSQNTAVWQNGGNQAGLPAGWSANGKNGQTVPYIIVIKTPEEAAAAAGQGAPTSWQNGGQGPPANAKRVKNRNKPRNNRRSSGWKMNRAGSSGWQWNPQGGREGWKWMDGWMGSGGGFGGWMSDKDTMYSGWRPTKTNGQSPAEAKSPDQRVGGAAKNNKKAGSKMVFVFGTKRNSSGGWAKPNGKKKNKQVIILDYTTAGKKAPKGEDGMKKDIESVIQALKSGKPANAPGRTVWKPAPQVTNQQQWGG